MRISLLNRKGGGFGIAWTPGLPSRLCTFGRSSSAWSTGASRFDVWIAFSIWYLSLCWIGRIFSSTVRYSTSRSVVSHRAMLWPAHFRCAICARLSR